RRVIRPRRGRSVVVSWDRSARSSAVARSRTAPYAARRSSRVTLMAFHLRSKLLHASVQLIADGRDRQTHCLRDLPVGPSLRVNENDDGPSPVSQMGQGNVKAPRRRRRVLSDPLGWERNLVPPSTLPTSRRLPD